MVIHMQPFSPPVSLSEMHCNGDNGRTLAHVLAVTENTQDRTVEKVM